MSRGVSRAPWYFIERASARCDFSALRIVNGEVAFFCPLHVRHARRGSVVVYLCVRLFRATGTDVCAHTGCARPTGCPSPPQVIEAKLSDDDDRFNVDKVTEIFHRALDLERDNFHFLLFLKRQGLRTFLSSLSLFSSYLKFY